MEQREEDTMLEISELNTCYGSIHAVKRISLNVKQGEIVTVIGSNGAGKTTLLNSVIGIVRPTSGKIVYMDKDITSLPAHKTINMGMSVVPEGREVFSSLTVYENLRMGLKKRISQINQNEFESETKSLYEMFPRLKERINQPAGTLSGGEQQMLVIARALISKQQLLLLDEPSLVLAPIIVHEIFDVLQELKKEGVTVLLVEQIANEALAIADRGYVIENGEVVMEGTSEELKENKDVAKAYLGV